MSPPSEPTDSTDPIEPIDATEPMLPTESTDPSEQIDKNELRERHDITRSRSDARPGPARPGMIPPRGGRAA